ncbi:MAG: glycosyltransferase [Planctomycetes bacterium]|nr:glycosyltransferase [Planctomycetota bacterium]
MLRILFVTTSMPVGGAETLLVNLVRGLDANRFAPEIACLKEPGPLGELLAKDFPVHSNLLSSKFDLRILPRLCKLLRKQKIDAVITVGAGDKMFWGRLAARLAGVPVVISALHSTGWPDSVGRLNRLLTRWTDAFIGVADAHAEHLIAWEGFPREKVHTIFNGVDTAIFAPGDREAKRRELGLPVNAPVVGILAALRPEKNHELFLDGAKQIQRQLPDAHFLVVGDGLRRESLEKRADELGIAAVTHFLGSRSDVPELLRTLDVLALTSHNEASPVSILEALSSQIPVVAAEVGSVPETVLPGVTGQLFPAGDLDSYVSHTVELLRNPALCAEMGSKGRRRVLEQWSLEAMVQGYESLLKRLHATATCSPLDITKTPSTITPHRA